MASARCHNIMRLISNVLALVICGTTIAQPVPLSPFAMVVSPNGRAIYVACATANRVSSYDTAQRKVAGSISMPFPQSIMAMRLLRRVRSKLVELAAGGNGNQHCWTRWFDQGKADQGRRRHFRSFHRFDCFSTRRG